MASCGFVSLRIVSLSSIQVPQSSVRVNLSRRHASAKEYLGFSSSHSSPHPTFFFVRLFVFGLSLPFIQSHVPHFRQNACLKPSLLLAVNCGLWDGGCFVKTPRWLLKLLHYPVWFLIQSPGPKRTHEHTGLQCACHISKETTSWTCNGRLAKKKCKQKLGFLQMMSKWSPDNTSTNEDWQIQVSNIPTWDEAGSILKVLLRRTDQLKTQLRFIVCYFLCVAF